MKSHEFAADLISEAESLGIKVRRTCQFDAAHLWVMGPDGMPVITVSAHDQPEEGQSAIHMASRSLEPVQSVKSEVFTWHFREDSADKAKTVWKELCRSLAASQTAQAKITSVDIELDIQPPTPAPKVDTDALAARALGALLPSFSAKPSASGHLKL